MTTAPIIITGVPRSGSSMIAGVFKICGAFTGAMDGEDRSFENIHIRDEVVVPYLKSLSADPGCQYPLPDIKHMPIPVDWGRRIDGCLAKDGYSNGPWMYKSSSSSLIWPVWNYAYPDAKWVIVRRRTGDIIRSCMKTDFMKAFRLRQNQRAVGVNDAVEGWKWWVHQFESRFVEMITEGLNCKVVWPERMVVGDYQQMFETIDWLGLKWKSEVLAWVDPKLWKARRGNNSTMVGQSVIKPVIKLEGLGESIDGGVMSR